MRLRFTKSVRIRLSFALLLATPVTAQWLHYPTPRVPKQPNGAPNLSALAPRTVEGKPDLSGIWTAAATLQDTACPPTEVCIRQEPLPIHAIHIGFSSFEQLKPSADGSLPSLLPYQPWAANLVKQRMAAQAAPPARTEKAANIDPHARCLPPNFPRAWALPQYKKIVQTTGLLVILHEFNASYRQIFTDGRPLPVDPQPSWNGYSSGKWVGDTLVVDTIGFRDDLWLDITGNPLTEAAKVTERIRRINYGTLEIQVTVNDPKAYTKPWTVQLNQSIVLDTDLLDDVCLENERDVEHYVAK